MADNLPSRPVELPREISGAIAARMAEAYEDAMFRKANVTEAMQAAYLVLRRAMLESK